MRRMAIVLAVLMMVLTAVYVVYAANPKNVAGNVYGSGTIYIAILYEGIPIKWYYPSQLGIIDIDDMGAGANATSLSVLVPTKLDPGDLEVKHPIFKWGVNGKFYQIFHAVAKVDFGEQYPIEYLTQGQVWGGVGVGLGWCFTGIPVWKGWRRKE